MAKDFTADMQMESQAAKPVVQVACSARLASAAASKKSPTASGTRKRDSGQLKASRVRASSLLPSGAPWDAAVSTLLGLP